RDGIQRRRAQRLAGAEIETGVVPRTAHRVADEESLGERAAVVRARGADGVDVAAAADEQHRLAVGVAAEHRAVRELLDGNALLEIGTGQLCLHNSKNSARLVASVRSVPSIDAVTISVSSCL